VTRTEDPFRGGSPKAARLPSLRPLLAPPYARDALKVLFRKHRVVVHQERGPLKRRQAAICELGRAMLAAIEAHYDLNNKKGHAEVPDREKVEVDSEV
jgi:hypothetical protein